MKERPIIMQARSIQSILVGRKTQTRRILKAVPPESVLEGYASDSGIAYFRYPSGERDHKASQYGKVGDRLWVRESLEYEGIENRGVWVYAADGEIIQLAEDDPRVPAMVSWAHHKQGEHCSPIHMPRWASR